MWFNLNHIAFFKNINLLYLVNSMIFAVAV